ncbi:MAG: T9SS type A sorting domain-containing protein, partial [Bacteroidota bacterium]
YQLVQIPLRAFRDDNAVFPGQNDGFDFSQVLEVVIAFSNLQGPELRIEMDEIAFVSGTVETSNEEIDAVLPTAYQLSAAYPNPFNPQAEFTLSLQQAQEVRVEVFDVLGRSVEVLFDGLLPAQSTQRFTINAQDWPSGTYLYRVVGQNFSETRSVVLLK